MNSASELRDAGAALEQPLDSLRRVAEAQVALEFQARADRLHAEVAALQRDILASAATVQRYREGVI